MVAVLRYIYLALSFCRRSSHLDAERMLFFTQIKIQKKVIYNIRTAMPRLWDSTIFLKHTRISEWIGVPLDYLKINNKRQAITDHVISNANCLYSSFITSGGSHKKFDCRWLNPSHFFRKSIQFQLENLLACLPLKKHESAPNKTIRGNADLNLIRSHLVGNLTKDSPSQVVLEINIV